MGKNENAISIGDEVRYRDRHAKDGFSIGKVINRIDHSILVIEILENGMIRNRLVDETEIEYTSPK